MSEAPKPQITHDSINRAKSHVILSHYARGTWPSPDCTKQLEVLEMMRSQVQANG